MKNWKRLAVGVLILAIPLLPASSALAFSSVDSLKGLEGMEVIAEEIKDNLENFNIPAIQIQMDVESKLRRAGIRILTKEKNEKIQPWRKPYLYIKIHSYKPPSKRDVLVFQSEISLKQQVVLRECPKFLEGSFYAPTWYKSSMGSITWHNASEVETQ